MLLWEQMCSCNKSKERQRENCHCRFYLFTLNGIIFILFAAFQTCKNTTFSIRYVAKNIFRERERENARGKKNHVQEIYMYKA